jgi:hypothetical protein
VLPTCYAHPYPQYLWIKIDNRIADSRLRLGGPTPIVHEFPRLADFPVAG